ncbi:competence/damage-inducible protein A [Dehalobacter sp. DCM]|uniref:competence/damage-inducible protein A n=1 Tax=Dehalobacter sp. DCM TaxID=2907827 RepID=UPI003081A9F3|nr:competence/damage-inducible protein A [Dehalobacter sp. DCM]
MKAEIISTGTELLLGKTLNTSAYYLTGQLSVLGIEVDYLTTVGDNRERLRDVFRQAWNRSQMVFISGGTGPTIDDLTKEIVAEVLGLTMKFDAESMKRIAAFYQNDTMPPQAEKQAYFPESAFILTNDNGTAPGAFIHKDNKYCIILPGPPSEMEVMFQKYALPQLTRLLDKDPESMKVRVLKVFGLGESELEQELADLLSDPTFALALLDKHTYIDLKMTVRTSDPVQAAAILDQQESLIREKLGNKVFAVGDETHASVIGKLLLAQQLTLSTAESCTGGLLGGRITAEAGCSAYYLGGIVSYANAAKQKLLGVQEKSLIEEGAVSECVAGEMAEGARRAFGADIGLATTGVAGPGGGTADKPVGLVYIALAYAGGVEITKNQFSGNRQSVREMTAETALNMLRLYLQEKENA